VRAGLTPRRVWLGAPLRHAPIDAAAERAPAPATAFSHRAASATRPLDFAELYRVLAERALDAIVTIDDRSTVLSADPAGERKFDHAAAGLSRSPLQRRRWHGVRRSA
jgi:PAS domain-containing protein